MSRIGAYDVKLPKSHWRSFKKKNRKHGTKRFKNMCRFIPRQTRSLVLVIPALESQRQVVLRGSRPASLDYLGARDQGEILPLKKKKRGQGTQGMIAEVVSRDPHVHAHTGTHQDM